MSNSSLSEVLILNQSISTIKTEKQHLNYIINILGKILHGC